MSAREGPKAAQQKLDEGVAKGATSAWPVVPPSMPTSAVPPLRGGVRKGLRRLFRRIFMRPEAR